MPLHAPLTPECGQNNFLSENGHVTYQLKENDTYNNMQSLIVSLQASSTPGEGSNVETVFFWK